MRCPEHRMTPPLSTGVDDGGRDGRQSATVPRRLRERCLEPEGRVAPPCAAGAIASVSMSDSQRLVGELVDSITAQFPVHRGFIEQAVDGATEDERDRLGGYLEFCLAKGLSLDYLAESYLTILGDTLDEQQYFRAHGHYRHATFADVAGSVYHDRDYMDRYMYGLAITTFLWPNHVAMARFLRRSLPRDSGGSYLEVGPGHGFLLMAAIETGSFDDFLGVDLSAASVEQTRTIVDHFHPGA